jgi:hypothetical protein
MLFLLLLLSPIVVNSWQSGCFHGPPLLLLPSPDLIPLGFIALAANFSNSSEVAAICSPSPACSSLRLLGQFCPSPQGLFEPAVCPAGYYCPSLAQQLPCPAAAFCPLGSAAPITCSSFSYCPEASYRELFFGPAALAIVIDVSILALLRLLRRFSRRRIQAEQSVGDSCVHHHTQRLSSSQLTQQLVAHIRVACGFGDSSAALRPAVSISFEDVSFAVGGKRILRGVCGSAASGKLTAIMGGSGSGKSTLLQCLRGRLTPDSGSITINGAAATLQHIQHMVGFCAQDDDVFLLPTLTVEETLGFAALTRMPRNCSASDRAAYVNTLIPKLGLDHVHHSLIGCYGGSRCALQLSHPAGIQLPSDPPQHQRR